MGSPNNFTFIYLAVSIVFSSLQGLLGRKLAEIRNKKCSFFPTVCFRCFLLPNFTTYNLKQGKNNNKFIVIYQIVSFIL
jgi:hypothetical protein